MNADEWAREFFSGAFVEMWLRIPSEAQTVSEADFLMNSLRLTPGAKVLDLCCGGGRHAIELATRGMEVTGVDISAEFLAAAHAAAESRGVTVHWHEGSILQLPWQEAFDDAYCLGNSLGGLDDDDLSELLVGVSRALKPGGRFVVDSGTMAESILPNLKERFWVDIGEILFLVRNRYDALAARLHMEFTFIQDGREERKSGFQQVYTLREFSRRFERAGFSPLEAYGSVTGEPFCLGAHGLVAAATKLA